MMCRTFPDIKFCGYRKVRDKEVIGYRPKWFKNGMEEKEWVKGVDGKFSKQMKIDDSQKECTDDHLKSEVDYDQIILDRLDNIQVMLNKYEQETRNGNSTTD